MTAPKSPPKICFTSAGVLVHQGRVLLVKHKKLQIWLNPGGHIEQNELPHQAAEREFWEETGVKVKAAMDFQAPTDTHSDYYPSPFLTNVHWISEENYQRRTSPQADQPAATNPYSKKGCEKHLSFLFLVEPVDGVEFQQNLEETDGIAWFTEVEVEALDTHKNIKFEVRQAFLRTKSSS